MANASGTTADLLARWRQENGYALDFFQAVRRLECMHPEKPRIGYSRVPQEDYVHFGQHVSLEFAPSTIADFEVQETDSECRLLVNFFGLLGSNGPFPLYLTEYVRNRMQHHKDHTLATFLDIFNHRMLSLFYRAWSSTHPCVSMDRADDDRFGKYIASLFGLGEESSQGRDAVADGAKIHYSGRLISHIRNAEGLQSILQDYFDIAVEIEQFIGQWIELPIEYRSHLGQSAETGLLGSTVIVGSRVWDCQQKFRLRFGPMNFADYERLLPGGESLKRLKAWVQHYTTGEFGWEVQMILEASEVPRAVLGSLGRLGLSTWLKSLPFTRDAGDLILNGE